MLLQTKDHANATAGGVSLPASTRRSVDGDGNGPPPLPTGMDGKELTLLRGQYEELSVVKRVLDARVFELQQQVHHQADQTTLQATRVEKAERDKQRVESELQRVEIDLQVTPRVPTHPPIHSHTPLLLAPLTRSYTYPCLLFDPISYPAHYDIPFFRLNSRFVVVTYPFRSYPFNQISARIES